MPQVQQDAIQACLGEMAERPIALVLKTRGPKGSGGSNPSLSSINMNYYNLVPTWFKVMIVAAVLWIVVEAVVIAALTYSAFHYITKYW
jgi:hypothetical protein